MSTLHGHKWDVRVGDELVNSWEVGHGTLQDFELQSSIFKISKTFYLSETLCLSKMISLSKTFCLS